MRLIANQGQPEFLQSISPKKLLDKNNKKERNGMKSDRGGKSSKTLKPKNDTAEGQQGKRKEKQESDKEGIEEGIVGASGDWTVLEEEGGVSLYTGRPGIECGIVVDASSYFDR